MSSFDTFKKAPGEKCQICKPSTIPSSYIRESPKTGCWCRKHWEQGQRCTILGCDEPVVRVMDGGDGIRCRAHLWDDTITDEDRRKAIYGSSNSSLGQVQGDNIQRGKLITLEDNRKLTKKMRAIGVITTPFHPNQKKRGGCKIEKTNDDSL